MPTSDSGNYLCAGGAGSWRLGLRALLCSCRGKFSEHRVTGPFVHEKERLGQGTRPPNRQLVIMTANLGRQMSGQDLELPQKHTLECVPEDISTKGDLKGAGSP